MMTSASPSSTLFFLVTFSSIVPGGKAVSYREGQLLYLPTYGWFPLPPFHGNAYSSWPPASLDALNKVVFHQLIPDKTNRYCRVLSLCPYAPNPANRVSFSTPAWFTYPWIHPLSPELCFHKSSCCPGLPIHVAICSS